MMGRYVAHRIDALPRPIAAMIERTRHVIGHDAQTFSAQELADAAAVINNAPHQCQCVIDFPRTPDARTGGARISLLHRHTPGKGTV